MDRTHVNEHKPHRSHGWQTAGYLRQKPITPQHREQIKEWFARLETQTDTFYHALLNAIEWLELTKNGVGRLIGHADGNLTSFIPENFKIIRTALNGYSNLDSEFAITNAMMDKIERLYERDKALSPRKRIAINGHIDQFGQVLGDGKFFSHKPTSSRRHQELKLWFAQPVIESDTAYQGLVNAMEWLELHEGALRNELNSTHGTSFKRGWLPKEFDAIRKALQYFSERFPEHALTDAMIAKVETLFDREKDMGNAERIALNRAQRAGEHAR